MSKSYSRKETYISNYDICYWLVNSIFNTVINIAKKLRLKILQQDYFLPAQFLICTSH